MCLAIVQFNVDVAGGISPSAREQSIEIGRFAECTKTVESFPARVEDVNHVREEFWWCQKEARLARGNIAAG